MNRKNGMGYYRADLCLCGVWWYRICSIGFVELDLWNWIFCWIFVGFEAAGELNWDAVGIIIRLVGFIIKKELSLLDY